MSGSWQWPVVDPEAPQYDGDTDQMVRDAQARANDLKFRLGGLAPGLVAGVMNDPQATGVAGYIPFAGAAASNVGMAQSALDLAGRLRDEVPVLRYLPVPLIGMGGAPKAQDAPDDSWYQRQLNSFYPTQLFNWANRVEEQNKGRAEALVPHPEPTTVGEREALNWGEGVSSLGLPITKIPGAVGRFIEAAAPSVVRGVAPGLFHASAPALMAGGSAAGEMLQDATRVDDPSRPLTLPEPPLGVPGASPSGLTYGEPVVGTPPPESGLTIPKIPPPTFDQSTPPPDFLNLGSSPHRVGDVLSDVAQAVILVSGARFASRLGAAYTDAARAARYAQESARFNTDLVNRVTDPSGTSTTPGMEAPLPQVGGAIRQAATEAKTQLLDTNAQAKAYVDATTDPATPDVGRELKANIGNVYNDGRFQSRLGEVFRTGVHPVSGITFPSYEQYSTNVARLDAVRRDQYDKMIGYADELDNRMRMQRQAAQSGVVGPQLEQRYNFDLVPTSELQQHVTQTMQDPELAALRKVRTMIYDGAQDVAKDQGYITQDVYNKIKAEHPNYMPTSDETGSILHSFGERTLTPGEGVRTRNTKSWNLDEQHLSAWFREIELNSARRALAEQGLDYQGRNPTAAKVFTIETTPQGDPRASVDSGLIPLRYPSGVRFLGVHNSDLRTWMMQSDAQMQSFLNAASYARNLYQQNTTGFWSIVNERFFPPTNVSRTVMQMAMNREMPMVGGLIDKGVQKLSGGRFGYTGPDPTTLIGVGYSLGADLTSSMAHGLSYVFDYTASNQMNRMLRAIVGDNAANVISKNLRSKYMAQATQFLRDQYQSSQLSERRSLGINQQAGAGVGEVPRSQVGTQEGIAKMSFGEINNMVPQLYRVYGPWGWAVPTYVRATRMAREFYNLANNAGLSYFYRMNRGRVSNEVLADQVADISGDPGVLGRSKFAKLGQTLPYVNVSAQGIRRQGEAIVNNPVGSLGGAAMHLTMLALGSIASAYMMGGPDAIRDLQEDTGLNRRASFPKFYTPNGPIEISLDQNLRGPYAIALDIAAAALGAADAHRGEDSYKFGMGVLSDIWDHHITNSAIESASHGLSQVADPFLQVPWWANVASVIYGGQELSPSMYGIMERQQMTHTVAPMRGPPNYVPDAFLDNNTGKVGRSLVSIIGGAMTGVYDLATVGERAARAGVSVPGAIGDAWWEGFKDNNPMFNGVLWKDHVRALSVQNPIAESVSQTLNRMKETRGAWGEERNEGSTRAGGMPVPPGENTKVPTDPVMRQLYETVSREEQWIQSKYMPAINDLKQAIGLINTRPYTNEVKTDMHNAAVRKMNEDYELIYQRITDLNADMSKLTGRHVDVRGKINWNGTVDQFPATPGDHGEPAIQQGIPIIKVRPH